MTRAATQPPLKGKIASCINKGLARTSSAFSRVVFDAYFPPLPPQNQVLPTPRKLRHPSPPGSAQ